MAIFKEESNRFVISYKNEKTWIEAWGRNSLRIRATKQNIMPYENRALINQEGYCSEIRILKDGATVQNGKIKALVTSKGKITFVNQNNKILLEEFVRNRMDKSSPAWSALEIEARELRPIIGGDYTLTMRFESNHNERLYGMGQYQQSFLNLKGCELELAHRNSQASVPFVLSSNGYGFLWNNPAVGSVTFGSNVTTWRAQSVKSLDYWITAGDTPSEIVEAYASVTGTVPMMPEYGMGFWQCKLRYQTQEELLNIAREYKRRNLPISVIVVDYFHWPFEGDWRFDPAYWPEPEAMVKELKEMNIELMVSVWPTVDYMSENFKDMLENGYLINTERGYPIGLKCLSETLHYDATNPEARSYLWRKIKKNYYDMGIRLFWLDEAEPEYNIYDFDNYRYHLGTHLQIGNLYPKLYARTFFEGMQAEGQENIMNLIRCAWSGSQKYGALVWSGDIYSSFESLRNQFAAGLNMGIAGIPWWTTDIGGFHGGDPDDPEFRELFIRWFEFGTFCPVMRLHGYRIPHKKPLGTFGGGRCGSGADNEVWSYGEEVYEICKKYMLIREKMKPYLSFVMQQAHKAGTPVMRPLFYDFPVDAECWKNETQYMFGPDLIVAPIMWAETISRKVYLPQGSEWTNMWTGENCSGGQWIDVEAPIEQIPLFTRNQEMLYIME